MMNATKIAPMTLDEFREIWHTFEIFQSGRFGWRRICGCANLDARSFDTREQAASDRDRAYFEYCREIEKFGESSFSR